MKHLLIMILFLILITSLTSCRSKSSMIHKLLRQTARWAVAARQDNNAMIAILHANYAAGYLWALKDIASKTEIEAATGVDLTQFEHEIIKTQEMATKKVIKSCPDFAPPSSALTRIAGEGI